MTDLNTLTLAAARDGLRKGDFTSSDLTEACLTSISGAGKLNAFVHDTSEQAREQAKAADARIAAGDAPNMCGLPIGVKDVFATKGQPTQAASYILDGFKPEYESTITSKLFGAGAVMLGKLNMDEFAMGSSNENSVYGPAINPWKVDDRDLTPGGSSGGSAAAVAADLCLAATGTDTGGSVRVPAAWNDLVGLKTTSGRLSLEGVVPLAKKFDTVGPLCRSVEDAALLLAALEGAKPADLGSADLEGRRLAILRTAAMEDLSEEPASAFRQAVDILKDAGATVEEITVPVLEDAMPLSGCLFTAEAYGEWRDVIEADPDAMYAEVLERFRLGKGHSGPDYVAAWKKLEEIRQDFARAVSEYDAVILPTVPILPPKLERLETEHDYYVSANLLTLRNTRIGNLMGMCAITLPTGTPSCGVMMMAGPGREEYLLRLAAAAEEALS